MLEIASKPDRQFAQGKLCTNKEGMAGYCVDNYNQEEDSEMCFSFGELYGGQTCDVSSGKCYSAGELYGIK